MPGPAECSGSPLPPALSEPGPPFSLRTCVCLRAAETRHRPGRPWAGARVSCESLAAVCLRGFSASPLLSPWPLTSDPGA